MTRFRVRRSLSVAATLAIAGGFLSGGVGAFPAAAALGASAPSSVGASSGGQPLASTLMSAADLAATASASGLVEHQELWSQDSRTFTDAHGVNTTVIGLAPLNYQDSSGAWQPIDDELVADSTSGYAWHNAYDAYAVEFPTDLASGPIRVSNAGSWMAFQIAGATGSGVVNGNTITYANALPGVTFTYAATARGLKETVTLANAAAVATFSAVVTTSAGLAESVGTDGSPQFVDDTGSVVATIAKPWVTDASFDMSGLYSAVSGTLTAAGTDTWQYVLSVSPTWLAASNRAWPVTVDPTVNTTTVGDADCLLFSGHPTSGACPQAPSGVGYYPDDSLIRRDVMGWSLSSIPTAATVLGSSLAIYEGATFYTTSLNLAIYRNNQTFSTLNATWNDADAHTGTAWVSGGGGDPTGGALLTTSFGGDPNNWQYFDLTSATQNWVSGAWAADGVVLRSTTEATDGVVQFNDSHSTSAQPSLTVTWDRNPGTPTNLTPASGTTVTSLTPTLTADLSDPDGGAVQAQFSWRVTGTTNWTTANVDSNSGSTASYTFPLGTLSTNATYDWRVTASDYTLSSTATSTNTFNTTDIPPAPTVSSSTHPSHGSWYSNSSPTISWTDSAIGLSGYSYTLDQPPTGTSSCPSTDPGTVSDGLVTTVSYNALADGVWCFHVRAQNGIGWSTIGAPFAINVDTTAPTGLTSATSDHSANSISSNQVVNMSWPAATDATSGVAGYSYAFNSSATTAADATVDTTATTLSSGQLANGTWWFHVRAVDLAGNTSADVAYGPIKLDGAALAAPTVSSATPSNAWTSNPNVTFTWTAPSDIYGLSGYATAFDHNPTTVLAQSTNTSSTSETHNGVADGTWYFHVAALNLAGTWSPTTTYKVMIDATAPALSLASSTHPSQSAWYASNTGSVTATASATSGITGYAYSIDHSASGDPGTTATTTSPTYAFSNLTDGTWYVHARAFGGSGLISTITTYVLHIDDAVPSAPALSASVPSTSWSATRSVTFTWSAPTSVSGIAGYSEVFDHTATETAPAQITTTALSDPRSNITDGVWYLHLAAVNNAGTWTGTTTYKIMIDDTAPVAPTLTSSTDPNPSAWYANPTVTVTGASSALSGINGYASSIDQNPAGDPGQTIDATATSTFTNISDGLWYVHVRAISVSGLASAVATAPVHVDLTPPTDPSLTSNTHEPNVVTDHRVATVDWSAVPGTDATSGIAGYAVTVNNDSTIPAGSVVNDTATNYTTSSLADGTYWFHVRAVDLAGNASDDITFGPVVISANLGLPYPVQNIVATAGDGAATVTWDPVDDNGSAITGYTVIADPDGASVDVGPGTTTAALTGLEDGTPYTFNVIAHNVNGDSQSENPSIEVVPAGNVGAPADVQATEIPGADAVNVSWLLPDENGNSATTFTVVLNPGNITRVVPLGVAGTEDGIGDETPNNQVTIDGLTPGTYTAQVIATGDNGNTATSDVSDPVIVNGMVPVASSDATATPGDTDATLSWPAGATDGSPITEYDVINENDGTTQYVDGADTSTIVSGLTDGVIYTFDIYATNEVGQSANFARVSVEPVDLGNYAAASALTPSNVHARRGNRVVTVTWDPPAASVSGFTGYQITSHERDGTTKTDTSTTTSATISGLKLGMPVHFTVATLVGPVAGPDSNQSTTVTPAGIPNAPTNVAATGCNACARLTWTTPANNGDAIKHYLVQIYSTSTGYVRQDTVGSSPQTIKSLANGDDYYFTVKAENGIGISPASAASNTVLVAGPPSAPTNVTASGVGTSQISVSWGAATAHGTAITKYVATAEPGGRSLTTSPSATSATISGLSTGVSYHIHVAAYSSSGRGADGVSNAVVLAGGPSAPTHVTASAGDASATVSWTGANANGSTITQYTVYSDPGFQTVTVSGSSRSTKVTGLTNGTQYVFYVYATNGTGGGPVSGPSNAVTPSHTTSSSPPPSHPSGGGNSSGTLSQRIARLARSFDQNSGHPEHEWPQHSNCTYFGYYWGDPFTTQNNGKSSAACPDDPNAPGLNGPGPTRSDAWCSYFAKWVWKQVGIDVTGATGGARTWMNGWAPRHPGTLHTDSSYAPRVGDLILWANGPNSNYDHVAIVTAVYSKTSIATTNGNYSDQVDTHSNTWKSGNWSGHDGGNPWSAFISPQ